MPPTHYETLELTPVATAEEIKKARLRLIKTYKPETHPEQFKRINEAYKVLADPRQRAEYDAALTHGPQLQDLSKQAEELLAKEDWAGAVGPLQTLLALHPASEWGWQMLAECHVNREEWDAGHKAYVRLLSINRAEPMHWVRLAWLFIYHAESLPITNKIERTKLAVEARMRLEEARLRDPDNPLIDRVMGHSYTAELDYAQAARAVEQAIRKNTREPDPNAYLQLARAYARADRRQDVLKVADWFAKATKDALTLREEGAREFAQFALTLYKQHFFVLAKLYIQAAAKIAPDNEQIAAFHQHCEHAHEASEEYDRLKEDALIIPPLRVLMALVVDEARNLEFDEPKDNYLTRIREALPTYDADEIAAAHERLRTAYPCIYELAQDDLAKL